MAVILGSHANAQERPVPSDSTRLTIPGCIRGSTLTAAPRREDEPLRSDVRSGQRFRLGTSKQVLKEMGKQRPMMVEVTGLVRTALITPGGIGVLGGRVRIGGAMPRSPTSSDVTRDPRYAEVMLDVESWQPLPDACPFK